MHLIYDFDGTLYSMHQLRNAWVDVLSDYSFSPEEIDTAGEKIFAAGYTLSGHTKALGLKGPEIEKLVKKFSRVLNEKSSSLVFADVVPFLEAQIDNHQTILTYGDSEFQSQKINASGIVDKVNDIKIAGPDKGKVDYLREMVELGLGKIVYIDNSPNELRRVYESGLPIALIRMMRPGERHSDLPCSEDNNAWQCVSSFEEVEI